MEPPPQPQGKSNGLARAMQPRNGKPKSQRSAVTNGRLFNRAMRDGRSGWSRRLGDLLDMHIADLGGQDVISNAERSIVRRIATISVELEWIEQSFKSSRTGPKTEELDLYFRGSNNLRRLLEAIGLQRRSRDVTPTLRDYLNDQTASDAIDGDGAVE
jgi:hypothetical protein